MSRMGHLVAAVVAVIVVVTGLSVAASLLRHRAMAGQGGEAGGHSHGSHTPGMEMSGDQSADHAHGVSAQHDQTMEHGGEAAQTKEVQPDGHAHGHSGAQPGMKHGSEGAMAPPATGTSAAEMLEPFLSSTKPADGTASTRPAGGGPVAAQYVCPMQPEVASNQPGKCPKCGMKLVAGK
jgi:hypothetical protein